MLTTELCLSTGECFHAVIGGEVVVVRLADAPMFKCRLEITHPAAVQIAKGKPAPPLATEEPK